MTSRARLVKSRGVPEVDSPGSNREKVSDGAMEWTLELDTAVRVFALGLAGPRSDFIFVGDPGGAIVGAMTDPLEPGITIIETRASAGNIGCTGA